MKKSNIPKLLCVLLLCLCVCACQATYAAGPPASPVMGLSPLSPEDQPTAALQLVAEVFAAAEPHYARLLRIVEDEASASEIEDDSEVNIKEMEGYLLELDGIIRELSRLHSELSVLRADIETSEVKTIIAARDYLVMLQDMAKDVHELGRYTIDFYEALMPLDFDYDEGEGDFYGFANQLIISIDNCLRHLRRITPPSFIHNTHKDLEKRLLEFQDFGVDFRVAVTLEDPLRLYSCLYRMNRIAVMFGLWVDNLETDLENQIAHAERRMKGQIKTLHDELGSNLALFSEIN